MCVTAALCGDMCVASLCYIPQNTLDKFVFVLQQVGQGPGDAFDSVQTLGVGKFRKEWPDGTLLTIHGPSVQVHTPHNFSAQVRNAPPQV
jgi:hypothetical protein